VNESPEQTPPMKPIPIPGGVPLVTCSPDSCSFLIVPDNFFELGFSFAMGVSSDLFVREDY
jgi:hypothetical protein